MNKQEIINLSFAVNSLVFLFIALALAGKGASVLCGIGSFINGFILILAMAGKKHSKYDRISIYLASFTGFIAPVIFLSLLYFMKN